MSTDLNKLKFEKETNLPLPIVKATLMILTKGMLPKHFFYTSKKFHTSLRVCNGPTKPISKIVDLNKIFK